MSPQFIPHSLGTSACSQLETSLQLVHLWLRLCSLPYHFTSSCFLWGFALAHCPVSSPQHSTSEYLRPLLHLNLSRANSSTSVSHPVPVCTPPVTLPQSAPHPNFILACPPHCPPGVMCPSVALSVLSVTRHAWPRSIDGQGCRSLWVICVRCCEAERNSVGLTVVGHPALLATVPRLPETFDPGNGFSHWLLQALPHWPLVRFFFSLSQEACF